MNKSALKSFATEARLELLEKIQLQARKLGITPDAIQHASLESSDAIFIDGKPLSDVERKQRNKLITHVNEIGYDRVMEEAAYTWFNRFIALRYMEVNDYLPTKVRVLSSVNSDSTEPDMFKEALNLDLPIDKELVYNLKIENKTDELFKYLIKIHCNDLNRYMPFMFETIEGYTEVLFPEGLLGTDTFVRKMTDVSVIAEEDWTKVEIVGWLYQYYISDENERVIKAKKKYKKEEIPYATQLFTPEWIVRYMVQNALGRYWVESHPEHRGLIGNWEYYLENQNPEPDFDEKIAPYINKELNVEDIKCFDPAMGSGHILAYMFDVLYEIYSKCGYIDREIPRLIIEKNLYGLDIDDRAFQLASFTVVMKAQQHNKRFLRSIEREGLEMNLAAIQESNILNEEEILYIAGGQNGNEYEKIKAFIEQFKDGKAIGSLIKLEKFDQDFWYERLNQIRKSPLYNLFEEEIRNRVLKLLPHLLKQAVIMQSSYDILVTNPPYLGNKLMSKILVEYMNEYYPLNKGDVFTAFMEYAFNKVVENGHIGLLTPYVWMFIGSYEEIRKLIVKEKNISSLIQLEYNSFEAAMVPVCTFTVRNNNCRLKGEYIDLSSFKGSNIQSTKVLESIKGGVDYRFSRHIDNFKSVPGYAIAYRADEKIIDLFNLKTIGDYFPVKEGSNTGNNDLFLRLWHEVDFSKIGFNFSNRQDAQLSNFKWFPHNKGGSYRKWYGNNEYLMNWENDGFEIRNYKDEYGKIKSAPRNLNYFFKEGITFSSVSSSDFNCRVFNKGFTFNSTGRSLFPEIESINYVTGYLNSKLATMLFKFIAPTLSFTVGNVASIPFLIKENSDNISRLVEENVEISKRDWDSFETSWDFKVHPLILFKGDYKYIQEAFFEWEIYTEKQFDKIKENEKILNQEFLEIYGVEDLLNAEVSEDSISIYRNNLESDIKSFISYAIGCIFGRFSVDEEGMIYGGGHFDFSNYKTISVVEDNILPILSNMYFENDILLRFIDFVRVTFSEETLEENLVYIADAIGRKKTETVRDAILRYLITDYYKDHIQTYKKRPIYWLFTSGKEKAFNCLIYMHRYDKTTLSRIRTDYVHEVQNRMDAERTDLLNIINGDSTVKEIAVAKKELKSLEKKIDELKKYDELLHHMADQQIEIDLDDGVKHNYELFKGLVAPIK